MDARSADSSGQWDQDMAADIDRGAQILQLFLAVFGGTLSGVIGTLFFFSINFRVTNLDGSDNWAVVKWFFATGYVAVIIRSLPPATRRYRLPKAARALLSVVIISSVSYGYLAPVSAATGDGRFFYFRILLAMAAPTLFASVACSILRRQTSTHTGIRLALLSRFKAHGIPVGWILMIAGAFFIVSMGVSPRVMRPSVLHPVNYISFVMVLLIAILSIVASPDRS